MDDNILVERAPLHCPPLTEVAEVLQAGLRENFVSATVSVVNCPDLKKEPFMLAASGLCGSSRVVDVGGTQNLIPTVKTNKIYDINKMARLAGMSPGAFAFGAGIGPWHLAGVSSELVANLLTEGTNKSYIIKSDEKDQSRHIVENCGSTEGCFLLNMFLSEGKCGKVLEVKAANRKGAKDVIQCMRTSLATKYGDKLMGLGGVLLIERGKAKVHVIPGYFTELHTEEEVVKWLNFYEISAPVVCLGIFGTQVTDLDLRLQHFHCFSNQGEGGHLHTDTTPDEVEYLGYFNLGESVVRVDRPQERNKAGRFESN